MAQLGTQADVQKALALLTDDRREAVLLHHVWGFSFREIGAMLGIREGTAKLRAYRAINTLREMLSRKTAAEGAPHDAR
jgi:RNA polymerase sigma-70 factor (ECF subfamily)